MEIDFIIENWSVVLFTCSFIFFLIFQFYFNCDISEYYGIYIQLWSTISFLDGDIEEIFFLLGFIFNLFLVIISSLEFLVDKKVLGMEGSWILFFLSFFLNELICSSNLIMLYVCIEASTFCLFLLLTLKYEQISIEGAIKYLLLSATSSIWLCFSFLLIYGWSRTFDILEIFSKYNEKYGILVVTSIIILYLSLLTKLTLFPSYLIAGDSSESLTVGVFLVLNIVYKLAALYLLLYFQKHFNSLVVDIYWTAICVISIVQGGIATFLQKNIIRFLSFGSVPQFGFIGLTIHGDEICQRLSILYLLFYLTALLKFLLFLEAIKVFEPVTNLADLYILNKNNSLKYFLLNLILELGGLPPSNLFFIKFLLTGFYFQFYIVQILIFLSLTILMCFYYLRLIKILFYDFEDSLYFTIFSNVTVTEIYILQLFEFFLICTALINV